jgi:hypothetical protein
LVLFQVDEAFYRNMFFKELRDARILVPEKAGEPSVETK